MNTKDRVRLDLNDPVFQRQWFALSKEDRLAVFSVLEKLAQMTWDQIYRDKGLHWELIQQRHTPSGDRIYSLRITQKFRATAQRSGEFLRMLTLHPDHDSAYH